MIDVVPTILEVTGVEKPTEWEGEPIPPAPGRSLVPAFQADVAIERDFLWWLHEGNRAIRVGDWKLVAAKGDPWALYDLRTDRAESRDLSEKQPAKAAELAARWEEYRQELTKLASKPAAAPRKPAGKSSSGR